MASDEKNDELKKNEKLEKNDEPAGAEPESDQPEGGVRSLPATAWIAVAVAALVVGVLIGRFLLGGTGTISLAGRTTLSAGELDSTSATYTTGGRTVPVTAREVL